MNLPPKPPSPDTEPTKNDDIPSFLPATEITDDLVEDAELSRAYREVLEYSLQKPISRVIADHKSDFENVRKIFEDDQRDETDSKPTRILIDGTGAPKPVHVGRYAKFLYEKNLLSTKLEPEKDGYVLLSVSGLYLKDCS